jgi:hypothetical protein
MLENLSGFGIANMCFTTRCSVISRVNSNAIRDFKASVLLYDAASLGDLFYEIFGECRGYCIALKTDA